MFSRMTENTFVAKIGVLMSDKIEKQKNQNNNLKKKAINASTIFTTACLAFLVEDCAMINRALQVPAGFCSAV